uniref:50S ribosomal protein L21, chloroplastic n=1 Tax=Sphondylothamnion multifidum TaxID=193186 RepID=A0A4D6WZZ1_9FLOR|nr:ribosomal protein L21 [Sphondylothamnion multifidum]
MIYAIIDAGGQQFWLEKGKFYDFNYISSQPGDIICLNRVLFLAKDNNMKIGTPCIDSSFVQVQILKHIKSRKVIVFKMKPKKNMRVKKGHRQKLTRVLVQEII